MAKYPTANTALSYFCTPCFRRKENCKSVPEEKANSSLLYKCFLLDTYLRSKNSKAVMRTQYVFGLYFTQMKILDAVWRLLQRLRILPTRETITKWLADRPVHDIDIDNMVIYSFDNCDFRKHVTHVRSEQRSEYVKVVTRFVLELPLQLDVNSAHLFHEWNVPDFVNWIQGSDFHARELCNNSTRIMLAHTNLKELKQALTHNSQPIRMQKLTILEPILNCSTASKVDIKNSLNLFYEDYMQCANRSFAIVQGDQQVFTMCWYARVRDPVKYAWVIPVPGEFHWTWHILRGIFLLYGNYILLPLSKILNYKNLDLKADIYHYAEDFFELVTLAVGKWFKRMNNKHPAMLPSELMHHYKPNRPVYELMYFYLFYATPYWYTRCIIKCGMSAESTTMWRYWLHLFMATNKYNYARMTVRFMWVLHALHPDIHNAYNAYRVFSFTGEPGTAMAIDNLNELVCAHTCI